MRLPVLTLLASMPLAAVAQVTTSWPRLAEFYARVGVSMASHRNEFSIPFLDTGGKLRYTFACKGGAPEFTDRLANQAGMQFPGTLTCVLNEGGAIVEDSLLAEDGVAIWHTRGAWWE